MSTQGQEAIIYGQGNLLPQIKELISLQKENFSIIGIADDFSSKEGIVTHHLEDLLNLKSKTAVFLSIGYSDLEARYDLILKLRENSFLFFPNLIHPQAAISSSVQLGEGNIVLPNTTLDTEVKIGCFNYLDHNVGISHHSIVGDNNFICLGTMIGGKAKIGHHNFIGMQSTLFNESELESNSYLAARSIVREKYKESIKIFPDLKQSIV